MSASTELTPTRISRYDYVQQDPWPQRSRQTARVTVVAVIGVMLAVGTLITCRRFFGGLIETMPADAMLATALICTIIVALSRVAWRKTQPLVNGLDPVSMRLDTFVGWGSSAALVLMAVGCCYPAYRNVDWLIWLPMLVADQFWRQTFFDAGLPGLGFVDPDEQEEEIFHIPSDEVFAAAPRDENQQIVQQLYRVRDDSGQEVIYGTLRADFHKGQRTAVLHVGFCPPLSYLPEIEADALPSESARLKIVQALAHGARLDVKLSEIAEDDCHLWIDMAATPVAS